jgi:hypothetical protein
MQANNSTVAIVLTYNIAVLAGTAWLVWHGWSAWWFLFSVCCLASVSDTK